MTPEEKRLFIAEMCDIQTIYWKAGYNSHGSKLYKICKSEEEVKNWPFKDLGVYSFIYTEILPDYLNDLNAIHNAWVKCIQGNDELEDRYSIELLRAVGSDDPSDGGRPNGSDATWALASNATAAQRADALINVKNNY